MKQVTTNLQIHPALEHEKLWRGGETRPRSKREQLQAFAIYLIRFFVIAALLLAVLNASAGVDSDGKSKKLYTPESLNMPHVDTTPVVYSQFQIYPG